MGLPIRELVLPEEVPWEALSGRTLAVDAYNALYQFLATIRQPDGRLFTDSAGQVTSHLMGLLYRTTNLLAESVLPVWVFDGKPPELKAGTLSARFAVKERAEEAWKEALVAGDLETARKKAAATSRLTPAMAEEAIRVLDALGVPSIRAPSEGEAQAAAMAADGTVWAAASEDYDSLLFGAPRLVRGLAARSPKGKALAAQIVNREETLARLGLSSEELLLVALLVGTDYSTGAKGYGPKKALKLAQQHLGLDASLRQAGLDPDELSSVAELFRHPSVEKVAAPRFHAPNESAIVELLVGQHGFSEARVRSAVHRARAARTTPTESSHGRQSRLDTFPEEVA